MSLVLDGVNLGVEAMPGPPDADGKPQAIGYVLAIQDPASQIVVRVPLLTADARNLGNALLDKPVVQIAKPGDMPPPSLPPR